MINTKNKSEIAFPFSNIIYFAFTILHFTSQSCFWSLLHFQSFSSFQHFGLLTIANNLKNFQTPQVINVPLTSPKQVEKKGRIKFVGLNRMGENKKLFKFKLFAKFDKMGEQEIRKNVKFVAIFENQTCKDQMEPKKGKNSKPTNLSDFSFILFSKWNIIKILLLVNIQQFLSRPACMLLFLTWNNACPNLFRQISFPSIFTPISFQTRNNYSFISNVLSLKNNSLPFFMQSLLFASLSCSPVKLLIRQSLESKGQANFSHLLFVERFKKLWPIEDSPTANKLIQIGLRRNDESLPLQFATIHCHRFIAYGRVTFETFRFFRVRQKLRIEKLQVVYLGQFLLFGRILNFHTFLSSLILIIMQAHKPTLMLYRRLLKTMMKVFDGDFQMFHRSRIQARTKILQNKHLKDEIEINQKIFFGEEIKDFLETSVIQGKLQDNGNYRLKVRKQHTSPSSGEGQ